MRYTLLGLLLITLVSCSAINKEIGIDDDSIAEEIGEIFIHAETGLNIDLTPSSPEK